MEENFDGKKPEELFREVFLKCQKLRISKEELSKLPSVKKLKPKKNLNKKIRSAFYLFSAVFVLVSFLFSVGFPPVSKFFAKIWFGIHGYDPESEMCVLNMPGDLQNLFMPPFDCSICRNLTKIERVTNISPEEFEKR
ncbi:hypothetical protein JTE90_005062 [Oedothorax gibbosus]|uniref:Uncharacterized protein n=1 Tax=Oedothorax gibbosus TaxID=931172 RepID=A0AAV6VDN5_9ARAC|nr:hypothetical protein JTE90_005062 [Oedothorax gibbosus]